MRPVTPEPRKVGDRCDEAPLPVAERARRWIDSFLATCAELVLESSVLSRARQGFPIEPVRTLDALHLASILAWDQAIDRLTIASCDTRVRDNAHALGFDLLPHATS